MKIIKTRYKQVRHFMFIKTASKTNVAKYVQMYCVSNIQLPFPCSEIQPSEDDKSVL